MRSAARRSSASPTCQSASRPALFFRPPPTPRPSSRPPCATGAPAPAAPPTSTPASARSACRLATAGARVHAVELAGEPLRSLQAAANARRLPLTTEARDLVRRPLAGPELDRFDLALLDPPRAGALAQARALAPSRVPRVLYAACDPGTFARDARVLTDAGFRLRQVRPIDQFLYSPEVELIARLERDVAPALP